MAREPDIEPLRPFGLMVHAPAADARIDAVPVARIREWTREHHLVVLKGFTELQSADSLIAYCAAWGDLMEWPFGFVLDVVEHQDTNEHIFDYSYVPLHWDGMYKPLIPEFQFFQCVTAPERGTGKTVFSDTALVWDHATPVERAVWRRVSATYRIPRVSHYGGVVRSPLVEDHPVTGRPVLRFNEPARPDTRFLNPHVVELSGVAPEDVEAFTDDLIARLYHPDHCYEHAWGAGDMVVADNHALLHGRTAFAPHTPRHLRRVHILGSPPRHNPALVSDS